MRLLPVSTRHLRRALAAWALAAALATTLPAMRADAAQDEYELGAGDRLKITVFSVPEISGEYLVGAGGTLAVPLAGRLRAEGLNLPALEALLAERLAGSNSVSNPRVSVEIVGYRPFFILGAVGAPGQYAYVPEMTVAHALAIAGGSRRLLSADALAQLELGRVRERYLAVSEALAVNQGLRARLIAERDDAGEIAFPDTMASLASVAKVNEVMASERRLLSERRGSLQSEIAMLESQKSIVADELAALEQQLAAKERLADLNRQEMAEIDKLRQRDLIPITRVLALRRSATEIESDRIQLIAAMARARQESARVDLAILNLRKTRTIQIVESLKKVEDELSQLAITRRSTADVLRRGDEIQLRSRSSGDGAEIPGDEIVIFRRGPAGTREVRADAHTPVLPGDLIRVPSRLGEDASQSGTNGTAQ